MHASPRLISKIYEAWELDYYSRLERAPVALDPFRAIKRVVSIVEAPCNQIWHYFILSRRRLRQFAQRIQLSSRGSASSLSSPCSVDHEAAHPGGLLGDAAAAAVAAAAAATAAVTAAVSAVCCCCCCCRLLSAVCCRPAVAARLLLKPLCCVVQLGHSRV